MPATTETKGTKIRLTKAITDESQSWFNCKSIVVPLSLQSRPFRASAGRSSTSMVLELFEGIPIILNKSFSRGMSLPHFLNREISHPSSSSFSTQGHTGQIPINSNKIVTRQNNNHNTMYVHIHRSGAQIGGSKEQNPLPWVSTSGHSPHSVSPSFSLA